MAFTYNSQEKRWYNNGQRIRLGNRIKNSDGSYLQLNSDGTSTKLYDDKTKRFTRGANNKLLVNRQDMDNIKAQHVFQNNKWRKDSVESANRPYIQIKPQIIRPNNVNPNISTDDNDTFLDKNHTLRKLYHKYAPKDTNSNFMKNINLAYDDIINYSNRNQTLKGRLRAMGDQARFINHGLAAIIGAPLNSILPESSKETIGQIGSVLDPSKLINTAGYAVRNGSWRAPWDKNNTGFLDRSVFGDGWGDTGTRQDLNDIGNAVTSVIGLKGAGSAAKGAVSGIRSASKIGTQAAKDVVTSGIKTAAKNTVKNISQAKDLDFVPVLSNIRSGSRMARNIKNTFSPIRTTQALGARKYLGNVAAPMWHYTMAADPMSFMYAGNPVSMKTYSLGQYKNGGQLIPKHQLGKVIKLIEKVPELAKKAPEVFERASEAVKPAISFGERAFNKAKNFVNGTAQATKEWNAQAGKKALVNKNGNFDNRFLWVRQAERKALQAGRNAFNDFSKNIAEADKTYLNAKQRSYVLSPEVEAKLMNAKQAAYDAVKDNAIANKARQIRNRNIKIGVPVLGTLGAVGYTQYNAPIRQYLNDLAGNVFNVKSKKETNSDYSSSYNDDMSRLAQIAYRQYVRKNGYPKDGESINFGLNPTVYKEINTSGKYAQFNVPNIVKAALGGNNQVEFTNGGMSGKLVRDSKNGKTYVKLTDKTAWDADSPEQAEQWKNGGIGGKVRYFMSKYGSSGKDNIGNTQSFTFEIPSDTISGDYKGRLRDIKPGKYKQ